MPTFSYKAKDRSGNTVTGTLDADNQSAAAAMIREMGQLPMDIRACGAARDRGGEQGEAGSFFERYFIYPLWTGVNIKLLAVFFRQMTTLLGSGMSLSEALQSAGSRTRGRLGRVIVEMQHKVRSGGRLSDVMLRHPRVFAPLQISLVRVGENSGMLDKMMDRIAEHLEYELRVRRMIAKMMWYPVIVLVFAFVLYFSLPNLRVLLDKGVVAFAQAVGPTAIGPAIRCLIALVVLKFLFQFNGVKLVWDAAKLAPPVVGTVARQVAMSRFSRALALMYSSGVTISEAVDIAADASANRYLAGKLKQAVPALQSGQNLTETLGKTGAVMPIVLDMLATGEKTGGMDATLAKVADYMDDESDTTIQKLGIVLQVLMILIAAGVVLVVALQFYSGYFNTLLSPSEPQ